MALIRCPECGKEISDKAEICVNCGYPLSSKDRISNRYDSSEPVPLWKKVLNHMPYIIIGLLLFEIVLIIVYGVLSYIYGPLEGIILDKIHEWSSSFHEFVDNIEFSMMFR